MTTLLIQSGPTPLTVNFPAIAEMTPQQIYAFCKANRDLRIKRTATGKVIIEPPTFSDTGNRSGKNMEWKEYIDNGTLLGWLIDRKKHSVHIHRPNLDPEILENPERVSGDPELPGFTLQMAEVW